VVVFSFGDVVVFSSGDVVVFSFGDVVVEFLVRLTEDTG
jgi:hypothetical protein